MKRALMVWGGWDGHTPKESTELLKPSLEAEGFDVDVSDSLDVYTDAEEMNALDLVVQSVTMAEISAEQERGLLAAVKGGVGFAGWHGGAIDSFRKNTAYQWMTGGQFVTHPGNCIPSYTVAVDDPTHEITQGIESFELHDTEQYYLHIDPGNHVLCSTVFSGEHGDATLYKSGTAMPYAWTRQYGAGRVFVASWGHTYKDFEVLEARTIMVRGMTWASR